MNKYLTKNHIEEAILALKRAKETSIDEEIQFLEKLKDTFPDGLIESVIASQYEMCRILNIGFAESFGNQPSFYFGLGLAGECGELAQNILRCERRGVSKSELKAQIENELDDVVVYSVLLALSHEIDLNRIVEQKCKIIIERAKNGYYDRMK